MSAMLPFKGTSALSERVPVCVQ